VDMAGPHDTFDFRRWGSVGSWSGLHGRLEGWIARIYTSAYEMNKLATGRNTPLNFFMLVTCLIVVTRHGPVAG